MLKPHQVHEPRSSIGSLSQSTVRVSEKASNPTFGFETGTQNDRADVLQNMTFRSILGKRRAVLSQDDGESIGGRGDDDADVDVDVVQEANDEADGGANVANPIKRRLKQFMFTTDLDYVLSQ